VGLYWAYRNKPPQLRSKGNGFPLVEGLRERGFVFGTSFSSHRWHQCFDLKSVKILSVGSITAFKVLSTFELRHGFILKRRLGGLREESVFKLPFNLTLKRRETILGIPE